MPLDEIATFPTHFKIEFFLLKAGGALLDAL
jgi:hypothetical protein